MSKIRNLNGVFGCDFIAKEDMWKDFKPEIKALYVPVDRETGVKFIEAINDRYFEEYYYGRSKDKKLCGGRKECIAHFDRDGFYGLWWEKWVNSVANNPDYYKGSQALKDGVKDCIYPYSAYDKPRLPVCDGWVASEYNQPKKNLNSPMVIIFVERTTGLCGGFKFYRYTLNGEQVKKRY